MTVTAFPQTPNYPQGHAEILKPCRADADWTGIAAGGAFLAGGLLLLSGRKRAGLVVTTAATAVTLLNQQDAVREWLNAVPGHLDNAGRFLDEAQRTLNDLAAKGEKLRGIFRRPAGS